MTTETEEQGNLGQPGDSRPKAEGRIGLIVATSLAAGLVLAIVLVAVPLFPATTHVLAGLVLLAFAVGWALLAVLSVRFSDQPQPWALAPAIFMSVLALGILSGSAAVNSVLGWVWPPALLALVVWMIWRARRQLRSRSRRWLLYPVLAVLVVASIGGGFQTVSSTIDAAAFRRRASWWTSVDASCICTAPARAALPSSWNLVTEEARLTWDGSRRQSPATAESACTTALDAGGAIPPMGRRTPSISRRT